MPQLYQKAGIPLIYIDESGFAHDTPRIYGYAPVGERCSGIHDWQAKGRINAVGALRGNELLTVSLFGASINSDVFSTWIKTGSITETT